MEDEALPQPAGGGALPPVTLSPGQEDLCRHLDDLHAQQGLSASPSDMFRGAVFAARAECRSNTDWLSQAANSLREILYPLWSKKVRRVSGTKDELFRQYGSVLVDARGIDEIGRVYNKLNDLTHHGSDSRRVDYPNFSASDFEQLLAEFERCMRFALTTQVDIHNDMDRILRAGPSAAMIDSPAEQP